MRESITSASFRPIAAASSTYTSTNRTAALAVKIDAYQRFRRNVKVRPKYLRNFKDITHPAHGMNQLLREILVHLIAQSANEHIHHIGLRIETVVPDMFEDHCLGHHTTSMTHEIFQQCKLARLQFDLLPATGDFPSQQIEREISH